MQLISAAAAEGNEAMVKYFIEKGADLNITYSSGSYLTNGPPLLVSNRIKKTQSGKATAKGRRKP
jgi:hypothetical protein